MPLVHVFHKPALDPFSLTNYKELRYRYNRDFLNFMDEVAPNLYRHRHPIF